MKFLDEVKIFLKSGDGGKGIVSFRHENNIPFGGPDGGNGGQGGDIIIRCVDGLNTLIDYRYKQCFIAEKGKRGGGNNRSGKKGVSVFLEVPVGTQILMEDKQTILQDMFFVGQEFILLRGAQGGVGNSYYKSSVNQVPFGISEVNQGRSIWVWFSLKLIADIGLVGMPNSGKSTFLSTVSNSRSKVGDYPFTTLHPILGCITFNYNTFIIADIPGLVRDSHQGIGLGYNFLRHIERCKIFLHLVDIRTDVVRSYFTIKEELLSYDNKLINKKEIVVLTKIDSVSDDIILKKQLDIIYYCGHKKVYTVSSLYNYEIYKLIQDIFKLII